MKLSLLVAMAVLVPAVQAAAAPRALIIGDSHTVGPFGSALDQSLAASGRETALYAVCGASSAWWIGPKRAKLSICYSIHGYGGKNSPQNGAPAAAPPTAEELLAAKPDLVVFALGSNPEGSAEATAAGAAKLLALVPPGTPCFWVGPPPMPKRLEPIDAFYKELPKALSRPNPACALIDSRRLIQPSQAAANDHFYGAAAIAWGKAAAAQIVAP
ncbi:MAG: hypothetical protein ACHQ51_04550 [Elusimicrobiota bacterium]